MLLNGNNIAVWHQLYKYVQCHIKEYIWLLLFKKWRKNSWNFEMKNDCFCIEINTLML